MFAVIKQGGRQYTVKPGDVIKVDSIEAEVDSSIELADVLVVSGDTLLVGAPTVEGAKVQATVVRHEKGDKILVFKRKKRKDYKKRIGHRSHYTTLKINDIKVG
jgi:large subunit ribosomal protein L21